MFINLMYHLISQYLNEFIVVFIDGILISSMSMEKYLNI